MTSSETYSFDLNEEMVQRLEQEFGPEALRNEIKRVGNAGITEAFFGDFGKRWMGRTLELGEQYGDRTYEVLKAAVEKTGTLAFPFIPERFVEIAYLSTQPIYTVPIVENGAAGLVFKMPFCSFYKVIKEEMGDEFALWPVLSRGLPGSLPAGLRALWVQRQRRHGRDDACRRALSVRHQAGLVAYGMLIDLHNHTGWGSGDSHIDPSDLIEQARRWDSTESQSPITISSGTRRR